jgi:hypothetical protein
MSPVCPLKPAWRIGMELLVSVEADDVINWGEKESDSKRGCWDTEGRISVFPIESWYGSYNITHCRAHVMILSCEWNYLLRLGGVSVIACRTLRN